MSYLHIYITIGILLALWDFRKYAKLAFWHIRFWNVKEYAAIGVYGPKPSVDLWSMPGYIRERNYFIVLVFILIWPIKIIFFNSRLNAFVRNVRAGRISIFPKKKEKTDRYTLDESLQKYKNIIDYFLLGKKSSDWIQIQDKMGDEEMKIIFHNSTIHYNTTLEDLDCPTEVKYTLYNLTYSSNPKEGIIWTVGESQNLFNVKLSGARSIDQYKETKDGKITHLEQIKSWIS